MGILQFCLSSSSVLLRSLCSALALSSSSMSKVCSCEPEPVMVGQSNSGQQFCSPISMSPWYYQISSNRTDFLKSQVQLTHTVTLISDVQHSDFTNLYVMLQRADIFVSTCLTSLSQLVQKSVAEIAVLFIELPGSLTSWKMYKTFMSRYIVQTKKKVRCQNYFKSLMVKKFFCPFILIK